MPLVAGADLGTRGGGAGDQRLGPIHEHQPHRGVLEGP
jgi:hypothetical protein